MSGRPQTVGDTRILQLLWLWRYLGMSVREDVLHECHILFLHLRFPLHGSMQRCELVDYLFFVVQQRLAWFPERQWGYPTASIVSVDAGRRGLCVVR